MYLIDVTVPAALTTATPTAVVPIPVLVKDSGVLNATVGVVVLNPAPPSVMLNLVRRFNP